MRFLQSRLHKLPVATDCRASVSRACRLCTFCDAGPGAVGDERHLVLEYAGLASFQAKYAGLFNDNAIE